MARSFAGILGCLAMALVLARCILTGTNLDVAATSATLALVAFAFIGCVLGQIADTTVVETVRLKLECELEASSTSTPNGSPAIRAA